MKYYTTGEIYRLGLLKNRNGKPFKHKASVYKIVKRLPNKVIDTKWGPSLSVSELDIKKQNEANVVY